MKQNKYPIRVYSKNCKQCGEINPNDRRVFCCVECREKYCVERKRLKPCKKIKKKKQRKINKCKNCGDPTKLAFCNRECKESFVNKNRLRRPCRWCDKMFKPTGKSNHVCPECKKG